MRTKFLPDDYDVLAPDGSQIRLLVATERGSMAHCTLPAAQTSKAITHRTVNEMWFCLSGRGEMWRKLGDHESVIDFEPGVSLTIETGTHFQFRNTGEEDLRFVITTMPPWPGEDEAVRVDDFWAAG